MVTKRVQRMMFAAAACIPLLLGSAPLYAQTSAVQQKLAALEKSSGGRLGVASSIPQIIRRCFIAVMNAFKCAVPVKLWRPRRCAYRVKRKSSCLISLSRSSRRSG